MKKSVPLSLYSALIVLGTTLSGCSDPSKEPAAQISVAPPKEPTPEENVSKWQKEAEGGNVDSQHRLGLAYDKGEGVPKDASKAFEWYQKAAVKGHAKSQNNLAILYMTGTGVPKDASKAFDWFEKAAAQGVDSSQLALGYFYAEGEGVSKDATKAFEWYQKAAAQGNAQAQNYLAFAYHKGEGVPKNFVKATEWWLKAAVQGSAIAQSRLGVMYLNGEGISQDIVLGYVWANLSAAQGYKDGITLRDWIEERLTATQRAEGQRLASNWKKGGMLTREAGGISAKRNTGTAFTVSTAGHALTNHHIAEDCKELKIAGQDGVAKVIASDRVNDLALLQLPTQAREVAPIATKSRNLRQGEDIVTYGFPLTSVLSSGGNLTPGTVSALTGLGNNTSQIQITAPIQPGSSGSPVLDKKAQVVGIVSMKLSDSKTAKATGSVPQNVNFAVNGQTVRAFLDANKVQYKSGAGFFAREKSNADLAEEARKWTVPLECWK